MSSSTDQPVESSAPEHHLAVSSDGVGEHFPHASKPPVDRVVFGTAAVLSLVFLVYGGLDPEGLGDTTGSILSWITGNFGWLPGVRQQSAMRPVFPDAFAFRGA